MWVRGDRMYVIIVLETSDAATGVDGRTLADIVDGRAAGG
jgi:hypothetical protein